MCPVCISLLVGHAVTRHYTQCVVCGKPLARAMTSLYMFMPCEFRAKAWHPLQSQIYFGTSVAIPGSLASQTNFWEQSKIANGKFNLVTLCLFQGLTLKVSAMIWLLIYDVPEMRGEVGEEGGGLGAIHLLHYDTFGQFTVNCFTRQAKFLPAFGVWRTYLASLG